MEATKIQQTFNTLLDVHAFLNREDGEYGVILASGESWQPATSSSSSYGEMADKLRVAARTIDKFSSDNGDLADALFAGAADLSHLSGRLAAMQEANRSYKKTNDVAWKTVLEPIIEKVEQALKVFSGPDVIKLVVIANGGGKHVYASGHHKMV